MQSGYLEEPGLPRVALLEPEPLSVSREPVVGLGRPQVELGPVTVEALPRRRHVLGVGVLGVKLGLLGVGAEGAGDDERKAGLTGACGPSRP